MPRWLFWRTGLGKDGRKERNHFLWNTICSESSKPTRLSTYQLVSFNLCYLSPLIGEWKYFHRVSSTIMSSSTHNNILGVTLSGDFGDVCTLSDLRPNHSWATPHKISLCLARPPLPNKLIPFLIIFLFFSFLTSLEDYVIMWTWVCANRLEQYGVLLEIGSLNWFGYNLFSNSSGDLSRIVSAQNIDRAEEAAAALPSLAMSWPSLQFGPIRGQHLQAVSYVLS